MVLAVTSPAGDRSLVVVGVPGDRDVDLARAAAAFAPADVEPATEADLARHPELVKGYIGPAVLGPQAGEDAVPYLLDPRIVAGTRWITGANRAGQHVFDLVMGRDFTGSGTVEAATVRTGDPAPDGSGPMELARGVEIGHIFQLGRTYAAALGLQVLDANGKLQTVTMGSYGIGVSRVVALLAELNHDEWGLTWPAGVAPYQVHVVATGKDDAVFTAAEDLARSLEQRGIEVCLDDRPKVSPGVKFKDAELIGAPFTLVVGKGFVDGVVEVKTRHGGHSEQIPVEQAASHVEALVREALSGSARP